MLFYRTQAVEIPSPPVATPPPPQDLSRTLQLQTHSIACLITFNL